jgi:hypothetical protein
VCNDPFVLEPDSTFSSSRTATGTGGHHVTELHMDLRALSEQSPDRPLRGLDCTSQETGGGLLSILAGNTGSQPQIRQAWRNADWANSTPAPCGSEL